MDVSPRTTEQTENVPDSNILGAEPFQATPRPTETAKPEPQPQAATGWQLWLERTSLVVYVVFCVELGMLLAVLPWTRVWTDNTFVISRPLLRSLATDNFVRGLVTGLGLVDIWLGIWEAVHYREPQKN
jgi:hypothetical protein